MTVYGNKSTKPHPHGKKWAEAPDHDQKQSKRGRRKRGYQQGMSIPTVWADDPPTD